MSTLYIEAIIFVFLPAIFAGTSSAVMWTSLAKPWLFFFILIVLLYVEYGTVNYLTPETTKAFLSSEINGNIGTPAPRFYFLSEYMKQMAIFMVLAIPSTWGMFHLFRNQA